MILFENVTKTYIKGTKSALNNVSVNIDKGEFVFLVGPSGAGKSTFMHLILREKKADGGLIQVAGRDVSIIPNRHVPIYRRKIGVVFQGFRLLQNKTVYENIAFALQVIGTPKHTVDSLVPIALETVGLKGKENRMPHELSGGEQQRVAIARAFVNKPLIILADEPTGNLDPTTSLGIMKVLDDINKMGTTIIMATHNEEIVNTSKRRVIELQAGKIVRDEKEGRYAFIVDPTKSEHTEVSGEVGSGEVGEMDSEAGAGAGSENEVNHNAL
jgi:cell division transport system ATP-binding protein